MSDFGLDLDVMDPYEVAYDSYGDSDEGNDLFLDPRNYDTRVWNGEDE